MHLAAPVHDPFGLIPGLAGDPQRFGFKIQKSRGVIMQWMQNLITIGSLLVATLAWIAKIRWSKEFIAAKQEILKAKDEQLKILEREIRSLREMTPMKIREYFLSVKQQLEEYNTELQVRLHELEKELEEKRIQIEKFEKRSLARAADVSPPLEEIAEFKQIVQDETEKTRMRAKVFLKIMREFGNIASGVTHTMLPY